MSSAARAEFVQLDAVGIVPTVLGRRVGAFPALAAGEVDDDAVFFLSHRFSL
jgi:hypothetical protein